MVECRITGVQPFGFFATVEDLGGDGLVLAKDLGQEYFRYDEAARALVGDESGETYRVGQRLTLRLAEANPVSGSLRFELPEGSYGGPRDAGHGATATRDRPPRPARPTSATAIASAAEFRLCHRRNRGFRTWRNCCVGAAMRLAALSLLITGRGRGGLGLSRRRSCASSTRRA